MRSTLRIAVLAAVAAALPSGCTESAADRVSATPEPAAQLTDDTMTTTPRDDSAAAADDGAAASSGRELATFGAGCFWCVEAVLEQLDGVLDVQSGYMGGAVDEPSYRQVCTGTTGHAEVVQVTFDPNKIAYETLLDWFWKLHDPTQLNRQGADRGTQYRSAIFWHSDAQRAAAEAAKAAADASGAHSGPIVTEITAASTFWVAEVDHQDYYRLNKSAGYCRAVIVPKLDKLGLEK